MRYVPAAQAAALREALAGYARFMALVRAYTEQLIQETRQSLDREKGGSAGTRRRPPVGAEPANGRSRAGERTKPREGSAAQSRSARRAARLAAVRSEAGADRIRAYSAATG
ncbi:MAG: hypothetical protein R6X19_03685 [Kiritimatiellia bacterium]